MGFIGGVTTIIDRYQTIFQVLGERFVQYHLIHEDSLVLARKAIENTGDETQMRAEIQTAFANFVAGVSIPSINPDVSEEVREKVAHLATFCVLARSGIIREGKTSRDIEFVPDPELPTRLTKELLQLASGLSLIDEATDEENYKLIYKIGLDSIPQRRRKIISMMEFEGEYETGAIADTIKYPASTTARTLEELEALGLLKRRKGANGFSHWWSLTPYAIELLQGAAVVSAKPQQTSPELSGDGFDVVTKIFDEIEQQTSPETSRGTT
jgi:DNA-binding MarR family transcriptional regulator